MPHWLTYYITDGMEETMLKICSQSERIGSEEAAAAVLQQRLSRKGGSSSPPPPGFSSGCSAQLRAAASGA
jgi:hypothetical protein